MPSTYFQSDIAALYNDDCLTLLDHLPAADLYLLDLPYGIALDSHGHGRQDRVYSIANDANGEFGEAVLDAIKGPTIAFASPKKPWSGEWRQHLVWDKGPAVGGGGDPSTCWKQTWELIQVRGTPSLNGFRDEAVLRYHVTPTDFSFHQCQKPIALLSYLIAKTTKPGGLVIDLTCGSGSTLVAAARTGRKAIGVEVDEKFCRIAKSRLMQKNFAFAHD